MQRKPLKLRSKILLSCLGCMLAAMLIQLMLFNSTSSSVIAQQTAVINENTLQNLSDDVYQRLKNIENSLITVYEHKDFLRSLSTQQADVLQRDYASLAYTMAYDAFDTDQNLNALYIYTLEHELISSYRHAQTPIYTYPEDIYNGTMKGSAEGVQSIVEANASVMAITSYYNDRRETRLVRCVLRILENGKTPIGYMVCDVDPKGFSALLQKYRYSSEQALWLQPTGKAAVLNEAPTDEAVVDAFTQLETQIKAGNISTPDGCELFSHQLRKYDLTVYSLVPLSALNANQNVLWQTTLWVFVLLSIAFATVFLLISRGLTKPLTQMVSTMGKIKQGATDLRLPQMKQDELGVLGSEFNDMLDRIEGLIAREYQTTLQLNDAKYKALQMQVNPHFLYNTLDTMSAIAQSRDCPLVSTLCQALSGLFRYSLNMDEPLAKLEDELRHLKNFLFVMNVRMQDSLRLTVDLPSDILSLRVPRLSLQPLVENAINHGLRNKRGEKRISISAHSDEQAIEIDIEDNGVGMEKSVIDDMLRFDPNDALGNGRSIGLRNINARVKLLFGEQYGLRIHSIMGEGCQVTLRLPRKEDEHA